MERPPMFDNLFQMIGPVGTAGLTFLVLATVAVFVTIGRGLSTRRLSQA
jgi:hypothetical protein